MKFMRFLFVQLALALFQIDLAVKQEIEQLPEQEEEHLIPVLWESSVSTIMGWLAARPWDIWGRSLKSAAS